MDSWREVLRNCRKREREKMTSQYISQLIMETNEIPITKKEYIDWFLKKMRLQDYYQGCKSVIQEKRIEVEKEISALSEEIDHLFGRR